MNKNRRTIVRIAVGAVAVMAVIAGCTNDNFVDYSSGGFGGTAFASSSSGYFYDAGSRTSVCDGVRVGAACSATNGEGTPILCEQGTSANAACNPRFQCVGGRWERAPGDRDAGCAFECPATYTESAPGLCDRATAVATLCEYPQGLCGCAPISGIQPPGSQSMEDDAGDAGSEGRTDAGTAYEWRCVKPEPEPPEAGVRCPHERPREGRECVLPITCDYGSCVFQDGKQMGCYAGNWVRDLARSKECDQ